MHILKLLDANLEKWLVTVFLSVMSVVVTLQVIMRYVFNSSLSWSEELARYLAIWLIYIGVSYAAKESRHVSVTIIELFISRKKFTYLTVIANCVFFLFSLVLLYFGTILLLRTARMGQITPALMLPMWVVYASAPVGFALTAFRLLQRIWYSVRELRGQAPENNAAREGTPL
jgi:TRAP-type C4-dicarboxylate transport system permease small subunit